MHDRNKSKLTNLVQKQPPRDVPRKSCFATLLKPHFDFKFAAYFQNTFSQERLLVAASVGSYKTFSYGVRIEFFLKR